VSGTPPAPRTGHGACLLDDGVTLLVHGGWDPRDDSTNEVMLTVRLSAHR